MYEFTERITRLSSMYIWETGVTAGLWHRLRHFHALASFGVNFLYTLTRRRDTGAVRKHTLWSPQPAHQNTNQATNDCWTHCTVQGTRASFKVIWKQKSISLVYKSRQRIRISYSSEYALNWCKKSFVTRDRVGSGTVRLIDELVWEGGEILWILLSVMCLKWS